MYTLKQIIISIVITAVVFSVVGFWGNKLIKIPKNEDNDFQAGWEAAKQRLIENRFMAEDYAIKEVRAIEGRVEEIKDKEIIFKSFLSNPLDDPELKNRIAQIDDNTKFYKQTEKDVEEYEREVEEYEKAQEAHQENVAFPVKFHYEQAGLTDIEVNQQILVAAEEDIKEAKYIKAAEIIIIY